MHAVVTGDTVAIAPKDWEAILCLSGLYGFSPTNLVWLSEWRISGPESAGFERHWWECHDVGYFLLSETRAFCNALKRAIEDEGVDFEVAKGLPESHVRAALDRIGTIPVELLSQILRLGEDRVFEWPVIRNGVYGLQGVRYDERREERLSDTLRWSRLAALPAKCPDPTERLDLFVWYRGVRGPEGGPIPTVESDIRDLGSTGEISSDSIFSLNYEEWSKLLAVSELYGFIPKDDNWWHLWPMYYAVFHPEEPHFWWDCGPISIHSFPRHEWLALADALRLARSDRYEKGIQTVNGWIPSIRRRLYRAALADCTTGLVEEFLDHSEKLNRWIPMNSGIVHFLE